MKRSRLRPFSLTKRPPPGRNDALRAFTRTQPCVIRGHPLHERCGPSVCAHVKTWASSRVDANNVVPLCWYAHFEQEGQTKRFERKYAKSLKREAVHNTRKFVEQGGTI